MRAVTLRCLCAVLRKQQGRVGESDRQEAITLSQDLVKQNLHRLVDDLDAAGLTSVAVGLAKLGYTDPVTFQELARHSVEHMQV